MLAAAYTAAPVVCRHMPKMQHAARRAKCNAYTPSAMLDGSCQVTCKFTQSCAPVLLQTRTLPETRSDSINPCCHRASCMRLSARHQLTATSDTRVTAGPGIAPVIAASKPQPPFLPTPTLYRNLPLPPSPVPSYPSSFPLCCITCLCRRCCGSRLCTAACCRRRRCKSQLVCSTLLPPQLTSCTAACCRHCAAAAAVQSLQCSMRCEERYPPDTFTASRPASSSCRVAL